jgi:hypothetical protein
MSGGRGAVRLWLGAAGPTQGQGKGGRLGGRPQSFVGCPFLPLSAPWVRFPERAARGVYRNEAGTYAALATGCSFGYALMGRSQRCRDP